MNWINRIGRAALFVAIISLFAVSVNAQTITSATSATALNLSVGESLTVAATPASISFNGYSYSAGTATASAPIVVTTTANLAPSHTWIVVWSYLGSASAALSGPQNIPAADVFASVDGGTAAPCTYDSTSSPQNVTGVVPGAVCAGTNGFLSNGMHNPAAGAYTETDTIALTLSGATNLIPGSYSGVLTVVAAAF